MDGDELLAVLDVPLEKRKEYSVFVRPMDIGLSLLTADNGQTDTEASVTEVELRLPWAKILSVYTQSGLLFINADYKRVIEKEKDVTWWSRTLPSGAVVLVAKKGYQAIASIMPETHWMTEELCDDLWHIAQAARNAFERQKGGTVQHEQQTMWRNEEDPEVLPDVRKLQAPVLPGDA